MSAASKPIDPEHDAASHAGQPPDPEPEMLATSHDTFSGFVRGSTISTLIIAIVLILLALFLL